MNAALAKIKQIRGYLDEKDFVEQANARLPWWRRALHFWGLVFRSFTKNRGPVRAAALTYTTLLAMIPFLALVVSITTGLLQAGDQQGTSATLQRLIDRSIDTIAPQLNLMPKGDAEETAITRATVVKNVMEYIGRINSGKLGVTAGLVLVFIAISLLSTVETMFNDIWGVTRGRTWFARIVQYWATISLGPLFLITALGLTTTGQLASTQQWILTTPFLGTFITKLVPFAVLTIFLTLFYRLIPATKVKWDAAFMGGLIGGGLLQLNNMFNVVYLSKVTSYSKIYGSLSVVPIFLLGLYFSWIIVLLGAQVAYAYQNKRAYLQEKQAETINQRGREFIALRLITAIGQSFASGAKPPTRIEMCRHMGIPTQLAAQVLTSMASARVIVEVPGEETAYLPARPLELISLEDVLNAMRVGQGSDLATSDGPERALLRQEYERILLAEMHAAGSVTLKDVVQRAAALPPLATAPT